MSKIPLPLNCLSLIELLINIIVSPYGGKIISPCLYDSFNGKSSFRVGNSETGAKHINVKLTLYHISVKFFINLCLLKHRNKRSGTYHRNSQRLNYLSTRSFFFSIATYVRT